MTVIALDAMGGDFAPRVPVEAAARAARDGVAEVILVGDGEALERELARHSFPTGSVRILDCPQTLDKDDAPTALLREKSGASLRVACDQVAAGVADAVISAGDTGALMVASRHVLGTLEGIDRPAIATHLPLRRGFSVLLDSGANVDCKPRLLQQFAWMGQVYARVVGELEAPRVALLSNGSEPGKGNAAVRQAHVLFSETVEGFAGNLEGRDLFRGKADVIVCDGFVGNLVLKTAEAADAQMRLLMKDSIASSPWSRLGFWLIQGVLREVRRRTDYREVGGSLLLGLGGIALVCHGASNARALENAIATAVRCVQGGLTAALRERFAAENAGERGASA